MGAPLALIHELDSTIAQSSDIRRAAMLRQLTDLFLIGSEHYSDDEIGLIDDVFMRLVATIETSSRALLAIRLGPAAKAPAKILRYLACDNAIEVASPVLSQAEKLDVQTLAECAATKSQDHLLAITLRKIIPEIVADTLVKRGDRQVVLSVARNPGARFSENGFGILVDRARGDDQLTDCVGGRADLPPQLFEQLLEAASEVVRAKLEAEHRYAKNDIQHAVSDAASQIKTSSSLQSPEFAKAKVSVSRLSEAGQLNASALEEFANASRYEEILVALSIMAKAPVDLIERIVNDRNGESLSVLAKAIGLHWEATKTIILLAAKRFHRTTPDTERCRIAFQRLRGSTAQQILAFYRTNTRAGASPKN